jgi:ubiquitin carboxyl-terminal hydrolase 1
MCASENRASLELVHRSDQPLMHLSDEFRVWCIQILSNNLFQQLAPIAVLLLVPTLFILVATRAELRSLCYSIAMGLDSFGITLPWNWSASASSFSASPGRISSGSPEKRKGKKGGVRTRAEQIAMNGTAKYGE